MIIVNCLPFDLFYKIKEEMRVPDRLVKQDSHILNNIHFSDEEN